MVSAEPIFKRVDWVMKPAMTVMQSDRCMFDDVCCGGLRHGLLRRNYSLAKKATRADDGNLANNDGCDSDCLVELCGNGVVDDGEL